MSYQHKTLTGRCERTRSGLHLGITPEIADVLDRRNSHIPNLRAANCTHQSKCRFIALYDLLSPEKCHGIEVIAEEPSWGRVLFDLNGGAHPFLKFSPHMFDFLDKEKKLTIGAFNDHLQIWKTSDFAAVYGRESEYTPEYFTKMAHAVPLLG